MDKYLRQSGQGSYNNYDQIEYWKWSYIYLGLERVYINKTKKISFFLAELKKIVWNNKYINNVTYFKTIPMLPKMKENMQIWDSECGYNK